MRTESNIAAVLCVVAVLVSGAMSKAQDAPLYERKVSLTTPWMMEFADLNGDDIPDMVGVNGNSNTDIQIFHGSEEGTFTLAATLDGESGEYYKVLLPDFNGDNVPDILAMSYTSAKLFLSSDAGYTEAVVPGAGLLNPTNALVADFNEDGHDDLFIKNECFLNDGNGAFTSTSWLQGSAGAAVTDYNNDDHLDIVMAQAANGTILFFAGKGNGTFEDPMVESVSVAEVIPYDLNTDGYIDIVAKGTNAGEVIAIYNDPTFSFSQTSTIDLGHNLYSLLQIFDVDRDGQPDLVTSDDNDIRYRSILADGTFGEEETLEVGMGSLRSILFKDAIGESAPDLVAVNGFGRTIIYTDKLNASIQLMTSEKVYDGQPFNSFFQTTPANLTTLVSYATTEAPRNAGTYDVQIVIDHPTYKGELNDQVTITKKVITVDVVDIAIGPGEDLPAYQLTYSGFVGLDNAAVLAELPVASSSVTPESEQGEYEITISGGFDENYSFEYLTGIISVNIINGIEDEFPGISIYPNPTAGKIKVNAPQWTDLSFYDVTGRNVKTFGYTDEEISVEEFREGLYILQLQFENGAKLRRRIRVN